MLITLVVMMVMAVIIDLLHYYTQFKQAPDFDNDDNGFWMKPEYEDRKTEISPDLGFCHSSQANEPLPS